MTTPYKCRQEDYRLLDIIGKGDLATTYRARCKRDNSLCIVKIIEAVGDLKGVCDDFELFSCVHSHFLAEIYGACCTSSSLWIISEYIDGHTLQDEIEDHSFSYEIQDINLILLACLLGLKKLHDNNIPYRNLKLDNILCSRDGVYKLTNFGIDEYVYKSLCDQSIPLSLLPYIAPEIINGKPYTSSSDIYSLGIVLLCLLNKREICSIHCNRNEILATKQYESLLSLLPTESSPLFSSELNDIIKKCLLENPNERPSVNKLLKTTYIRNIINTVKTVLNTSSLPLTTSMTIMDPTTYFDNLFSPFLLSPLSPKHIDEEYKASEYFPSSSIMTNYYTQYVLYWIGQKHHFQLIYNGSSMGYSSIVFHQHCDNQGPLLILIKTQNENKHSFNIFGAYTTVSWMSPDSEEDIFIQDKTAFLFTLRNPHNTNPLKFNPIENGWSIIFNRNKHIQLGSGSDKHKDIYIEATPITTENIPYSTQGSTFFNGYNGYENTTTFGCSLFVNTGNQQDQNHFIVQDIEVFKQF